MKNAGRSTTGEAAVPYYLGTRAQEAAKHLRLTASQFLAERASAGELDAAARIWLNVSRPSPPAPSSSSDKLR